jgi:hypothetical protein
MAVLQKIRQRSSHTRYWVLFISFIIGDIL